MDDNEKLKLISEIQEAGSEIRHSIIIMAVCFIACITTWIISMFEFYRLGFDIKVLIWLMLSMILFRLNKLNSPDPDKLERYVSLVREYNAIKDEE